MSEHYPCREQVAKLATQRPSTYGASAGYSLLEALDELAAQATLLSLTQSELEQALADKQAAEAKVDELECTLGDEEAAHQETLRMLQAAEASAAAMRLAWQKMYDGTVGGNLDNQTREVSSASWHAMRKLFMPTPGERCASGDQHPGQHLLDELEGLRELVADNWLVWSNEHAAWWGPNERGYYTSINSAGRYSFEDAARICKMRSPKTEGNPNELIQPSPEWIAALAALKARQ